MIIDYDVRYSLFNRLKEVNDKVNAYPLERNLNNVMAGFQNELDLDEDDFTDMLKHMLMGINNASDYLSNITRSELADIFNQIANLSGVDMHLHVDSDGKVSFSGDINGKKVDNEFSLSKVISLM